MHFHNFQLKSIVIGSSVDISREKLSQIFLDSEFIHAQLTLKDPTYFNFRNSDLLPMIHSLPKGDTKDVLLKIITKLLGHDIIHLNQNDINFVKHHDSHLGCGIGVSNPIARTLVLSLDAEGDGESGAVQILKGRSPTNRATISSNLDSLGYLYGMVTHYYGFRQGRHEGKITGLAAYGKYSAATEILQNHVRVQNGYISLKYVKRNELAGLIKLIRQLGIARNVKTSLYDIVSAAASETKFYPDLAFAVQEVLESTVCEVTSYWLSKFEIHDVSLAGGVFSNVRLNAKLSELSSVRSVSVFPNMGDGGLSIGGIWNLLAQREQLGDGPLFENMYLSDEFFNKFPIPIGESDLTGIQFNPLENNHLVEVIVRHLIEGRFVGIHQNGVEFGPRALGNRTILFDPRNPSLGEELNKRLKRTEFMPFAPIVLKDFFDEYMGTENQSRQPFEYMTMTCKVKK